MNAEQIITSVHAALRRWPGYSRVERAFSEYDDLQVFVAGGFVRNIVLGKSLSKDVDLFLNGSSVAPFINRLLANGHATRNSFGKWKWSSAEESPHTFDLLAIPDFRVGPRRYFTLDELMTHFDLTCNSIGLDLRTMRLIDPSGGIESCRRRELRMNPCEHPEYRPLGPDNPLTTGVCLWFRALDYASRLNLSIESGTKRWLVAHKHYLKLQPVYESAMRRQLDLRLLRELESESEGPCLRTERCSRALCN
jgi:Poly A polymerase head domain